jgi:hypothetical protein
MRTALLAAALAAGLPAQALAQAPPPPLSAQQPPQESFNDVLMRHLKAHAGDCGVELARWEANADFLNTQLTSLYGKSNEQAAALAAANKAAADSDAKLKDAQVAEKDLEARFNRDVAKMSDELGAARREAAGIQEKLDHQVEENGLLKRDLDAARRAAAQNPGP